MNKIILVTAAVLAMATAGCKDREFSTSNSLLKSESSPPEQIAGKEDDSGKNTSEEGGAEESCPQYEIDGDTITIIGIANSKVEDDHIEFHHECQIEKNGVNFQYNFEFNGELSADGASDEGLCPLEVSHLGDGEYSVVAIFEGQITDDGRFEIQYECEKANETLMYEANLEVNLEIQ